MIRMECGKEAGEREVDGVRKRCGEVETQGGR